MTVEVARSTAIDPIKLEILWTRFQNMVDEQAVAVQRTAFSPIVREAGDCSVGIFDREGRMLAQAITGTPGHIFALPTCVKNFLGAYPIDTLEPGDVLIGNNAYINCGHQFDITVMAPIFRDGEAIAIYAGTVHVVDIGGRQMSAEGRDNFEEGLNIPVMKLYRAGVPNDDLIRIIEANVRAPIEVMGDISAVVGTIDVGGARLLGYLEELDMPTLDPVADAVIERSEKAMRSAIEEIPDGVYTHVTHSDGFSEPITIAARVEVKGDEILVDYAGSSNASQHGINVVLNYTHAYTAYAIKCAIAPDVPNNEGSLRPVKVTAPPGSLLNAQPPAPVAMRHVMGHFLPDAVFGALASAIPQRVIAEGAAAVWYTTFSGRSEADKPYVVSWISAGGMGARPNKDGLDCAAFPTGTASVPAEVIETLGPIVVRERTFRTDSGGPGRFRGGCGQRMSVELLGTNSALFSSSTDRIRHPAKGAFGGADGAPGVLGGTPTVVQPKAATRVPPGEIVTMELPGGGGFFSPLERDPELVADDVRDGYVSREGAARDYGVALDPTSLTVDVTRTAALRKMAAG